MDLESEPADFLRQVLKEEPELVQDGPGKPHEPDECTRREEKGMILGERFEKGHYKIAHRSAPVPLSRIRRIER